MIVQNINPDRMTNFPLTFTEQRPKIAEKPTTFPNCVFFFIAESLPSFTIVSLIVSAMFLIFLFSNY
jgi:hypothetical protein